MPVQVLFGGEVDPSDKGHAGAGQFSNDTYCYDPSTVPSCLASKAQPAVANYTPALVDHLAGVCLVSPCLAKLVLQ